MSNILALCDTVTQTSLAIHQYFRSGHLEKVYENTLAHRLRNKAIDVKQQMPIDIYDEDGTLVGHYTADLLIESQLIVELKACHTLTTEHFAQVFGYLRGSRLRHGIESLHPRAVVATHKRPENDDNPTIIEQTRQYIRDFDRLAGTTTTAQELYDKMLELYPNRVNPGWALWSSARAVKS